MITICCTKDDLRSRKGEGLYWHYEQRCKYTPTMGIFKPTKHKRNHDSVQPVSDEWMNEQCFYLLSTTFNLQPLRRKKNILENNKWQRSVFKYLMSKRQGPQNVYDPGKWCLLSKIFFMFAAFNSMVARTQRDVVEERRKFVRVRKLTARIGLQNTERIMPLTYQEIRWFVASLSG